MANEQKILTILTKIKKGDWVGRQISEGSYCREEAAEDGIHIQIGSHTTFLSKNQITKFLKGRKKVLEYNPWETK